MLTYSRNHPPQRSWGLDRVDFVERERTPSELMKIGIRLHLARLSLSNTIRELEKFGTERSRKAVHDWVQKADL